MNNMFFLVFVLGSKEIQFSLFILFKLVFGSWICDICMIQNKGDVSKCVVCQISKLGVGVFNLQVVSVGNYLIIWRCGVYM